MAVIVSIDVSLEASSGMHVKSQWWTLEEATAASHAPLVSDAAMESRRSHAKAPRTLVDRVQLNALHALQWRQGRA